MELRIDAEDLKPLVERVVTETLTRLDELRAALPDRVAFSEEEAARLLGLEPHQLRDERRRGRIKASKIVGRRVRYFRADLVQYIMERRISG